MCFVGKYQFYSFGNGLIYASVYHYLTNLNRYRHVKYVIISSQNIGNIGVEAWYIIHKGSDCHAFIDLNDLMDAFTRALYRSYTFLH